MEVNPPDRQARRRRGKSDPTDAEAAARAVQAGQATVAPKAGTGQVEMIRSLRVARATATLVAAAAALVPGPITSLLAAALLALGTLARRHQALNLEIKALTAELDRLTATAAPKLVALFGIGQDNPGALLVAAGDNPQRLRSEACFAMLCGSSPIQASSGKTVRHRRNRGGDRQANAALSRIVLVRLRYHQPTKDYLTRRLAEGKPKNESIRCLKRYIAREVFAALQPYATSSSPHPLDLYTSVAQVEGSGRTGLACPTPSHKRPPTNPAPEPTNGRRLIQSGRLRWLHRLPLVLSRHATVSTVPRVQGQSRPPGQAKGDQHWGSSSRIGWS
jgi:transposase